MPQVLSSICDAGIVMLFSGISRRRHGDAVLNFCLAGIGDFLDADLDDLTSLLSFTVDYLAGSRRALKLSALFGPGGPVAPQHCPGPRPRLLSASQCGA